MTELLCKIFVKDRQNTKNALVRASYGKLSSIVGIILNLLLAVGKYTTGLIFGAISLQADGINNLSDAGSQIISLVSFKVASKPADRDHPFGHARFEYIASMIVSFLILYIGLNTMIDSVKKIFSPDTDTRFDWLIIIVLGVSVLVKLWLCLFNRKISKKIDSSMLRATSADSLSDACATAGVLIGMLVFKFTGLDIDAYMGAVVAVLILVAGIKIFNETKNSLLGEKADDEVVESVVEIVDRYPEALGIHDMIVHNYGPGRMIVTLHVEVDYSDDIMHSHDVIDNIEKVIFTELGIQATIHMDPIVTDNPEVNVLRERVRVIVKEIDERLDMHDFRAVFGETHSNLLFDINAPFEVKTDDAEIKRIVGEKISEINSTYFAIITVDRG